MKNRFNFGPQIFCSESLDFVAASPSRLHPLENQPRKLSGSKIKIQKSSKDPFFKAFQIISKKKLLMMHPTVSDLSVIRVAFFTVFCGRRRQETQTPKSRSLRPGNKRALLHKFESGIGLPHSKTSRKRRHALTRASVVECGSSVPLSRPFVCRLLLPSAETSMRTSERKSRITIKTFLVTLLSHLIMARFAAGLGSAADSICVSGRDQKLILPHAGSVKK